MYLFPNPLSILLRLRIDADDISFVDEEGSIDGRTGLESDDLAAAGGGVALDARGRFSDFEVDGDGHLESHGLFLEEELLDDRIRLEELGLRAGLICGDLEAL